jgi:voltage-gated sodium channel
MFYIYAVAGVHLFGASDADFGSLPVALLTLFRVVTLDNWGDFFHRALEHAHPLLVAVYFVSFIVLGTMIILNLFIGIVMNSMAEMHKEMEAGAAPPAADAAEFAALESQLAAAQARLQALRARFATPAGQSPRSPPPSGAN